MKIWHPYTQEALDGPPIRIDRGEGAWLLTSDGVRLFDGISSWWVNLHGHAHPLISDAIAVQARKLEQVIFAGFTHEPAEELAARLGSARLWSLACVHGPAPCGVAWNTLVLALLTATGTTVLGGLLALAELRSGWRLARLLRILAPVSFVAPPFVTALALILLFGRSGLVSQGVEALFGVVPGRWQQLQRRGRLALA